MIHFSSGYAAGFSSTCSTFIEKEFSVDRESLPWIGKILGGHSGGPNNG